MRVENNPGLITIIVPVCNGEKYLEECLTSICQQSYTNIEVLIIDNGSTDDSIRICNKFVKIDNRIKLLFCEKRGASNARNVGLKAASGMYVMFVDSDDYVEQTFCNDMIRSIKDYNSDMAVCSINKVDKNGKLERRVGIDNRENGLLSNQEIYDLFHNELLNSLCNKIYKKNFITFFMNPDYRVGEDLDFNIRYLSNTQKVSYVKKNLYNNRNLRHRGVLLHKYYAVNRLDTLLDIYGEMRDWLNVLGIVSVNAQRLKEKYTQDIVYVIKEYWRMPCKEIYIMVTLLMNNPRVNKIVDDVTLTSLPKKIIVQLIKSKQSKVLAFLIVLYKLNKFILLKKD